MLTLGSFLLLQLFAGASQAPRDARAAPPPLAASISGRVVSTDGQPVRHARVSVTADGADDADPVLSDALGRFSVSNLEPGRYTIAAAKPGFVSTRFGARRALDKPIELQLEAGRAVRDVSIVLSRAAAISGRILDETGDPMVGVEVSVGEIMRGSGAPHVETVRSTETDDLGEYRVGDLSPARFVVMVRPGGLSGLGRGQFVVTPGAAVDDTGYLPTYFPSVLALSQARPLITHPGDELTGIDIVMHRARMPRLTVSVTDSTGAPVAGRYSVLPLTGRSGRAGRFDAGETLTTVLEPGDWRLVVTAAAGTYVNDFTIADQDVSLTAMLERGATIAGRVIYDGTRIPAGAALAIESGARAPGVFARGTVRADGTFTLSRLFGTFAPEVRNLPRGWVVKSFVLNGRDLIDTPLVLKDSEALSGAVVTVSNRLTTLAGAVRDASGNPAPGSNVLVFPFDPALARSTRRVRWAKSSMTGDFSVEGLPAGDYVAIALDDVDETAWPAPDYLDALRPSASRVRLVEAQRVLLDLRLEALR